MLTYSSDKVECFARNFYVNSTHDSFGVILINFPPGSESRLSDIHINPPLVSAIISNQDPYKVWRADGILVILSSL